MVDRFAPPRPLVCLDAWGGMPAAARAGLERQSATTGEVIPNRIPVRRAIAILCREYAAAHPGANAAPPAVPAPIPAPAPAAAPGPRPTPASNPPNP